MQHSSVYDNIKHYINFYYFTQGNFFTGTVGNSFRYRIEPDKANNVLMVYTYSDVCFEKAENKICESFEYSEEGLDAAAKWIALKNSEYLENN